jgi:hypothetical protein
MIHCPFKTKSTKIEQPSHTNKGLSKCDINKPKYFRSLCSPEKLIQPFFPANRVSPFTQLSDFRELGPEDKGGSQVT